MSVPDKAGGETLPCDDNLTGVSQHMGWGDSTHCEDNLMGVTPDIMGGVMVNIS